MHRIFVNFRTGDQDMAAPFVYEFLSNAFGDDEVFFSSHSIRAGADFTAELLERASQCDVLLALIGPRWLTVADGSGRPLLTNPADWVRREIAAALAANRVVLPVLVAGAARLDERDLPEDIVPLARAEYRHLRRRDHAADLENLKNDLMKLIPGLTARPADSQLPQVRVQADHVSETGYAAGVRIGRVHGPVNTNLGIDASVEAKRIDGTVVGVDIGESEPTT